MAAVIDKDMGYKDLLKAFEADGVILSVGIPPEAGADVVQRAAINEFGSANGLIPERSFLRSTLRRHESEYADILQDGATRSLAGKTNMVQVLTVLGRVMVRDIWATIRVMTPPNAPSTIRKKGRDQPLIDTWEMFKAITFAITFDVDGGDDLFDDLFGVELLGAPTHQGGGR